MRILRILDCAVIIVAVTALVRALILHIAIITHPKEDQPDIEVTHDIEE